MKRFSTQTDAQTLLGLTPIDVLPLPFDAKCTIKQATRCVRREDATRQQPFLVNCASGRIWER